MKELKNYLLAGAITLSMAKSAEAQTVVYESENFRLQVCAVVDSSLARYKSNHGNFPHDTLEVFSVEAVPDSIRKGVDAAGFGVSGKIYLDENRLAEYFSFHELGHATNGKFEYFKIPISVSKSRRLVGVSGFILEFDGDDGRTFNMNIEEGVTEYLTQFNYGITDPDSVEISVEEGIAELSGDYKNLSRFFQKCVLMKFFTPYELQNLKINNDVLGLCRLLFNNENLEYSPELILYVENFFRHVERGNNMTLSLHFARSHDNFLEL